MGQIFTSGCGPALNRGRSACRAGAGYWPAGGAVERGATMTKRTMTKPGEARQRERARSSLAGGAVSYSA